MDQVTEVVVRTVNFLRNRGSESLFVNILSNLGLTFSLSYHTEERWLNRGARLKRFFNLREETEQCIEKNGCKI